ncbi:hypothetical protein D9V37_02785 [Nocardioides mangrovicus]|uniref:Uncharacterized protein n=1 Tax=Nocardioides mangrovicus TaxID=2478913 RepID=A0A3L8P884_9ACTN|nr:hypothetical protein [Nocardioides mangrovicus]RLV50889.1 hypothetical protein D9V37_02785 [Nocardioides mangrovicus]
MVDQSLFNPAYRGIGYWDAMRKPTYVGWLGTSAFMLLTFVGGHVLGSIAASLALAESWWPECAGRPWLRRRGLVGAGRVPPAWWLLVLSKVLLGVRNVVGTGWVSVAMVVVSLVAWLVAWRGWRVSGRVSGGGRPALPA